MADLFLIRATCPKDGWTITLPLNREDLWLAILQGQCKLCRGPVAVEPAHLGGAS